MASRKIAGVLMAAAAVTAGGAIALTTAGSAAAITPACGNSSLAVTHTLSQGATGHGSVNLLFRNQSSATCTLYGYPGLDALSSTSTLLAHAKRTLHGFAGGVTSISTVTLAPGGFASAIVEWMNFNPVTSGPCTFSKYIAATPANTSHTVKMAVSVSLCDLQVHPTEAGTLGWGHFADAQREWIRGVSFSSASQGVYWNAAKTDLKLAGTEFSTEVSELTTLIALPDANQTPAQNAKWHQEINALNSFFGTPGLYL